MNTIIIVQASLKLIGKASKVSHRVHYIDRWHFNHLGLTLLPL